MGLVATTGEIFSPFEGPDSLRVRGEWPVLWLSIALIAIAAPLLAWFFPLLASGKELALLAIAALVYVTLARGRLIGGSIRVHAQQFGHVHEITIECARALRMTAPLVFVRDDPFVPIVAVGVGEPYSLIISTHWIEHLQPGELRFLIGRELAHIAAGHTRITSLLSINGRENGIVAVLFGAWLRRIEYTADRAGFLCCGGLDDAIAAIAISTFGIISRSIDVRAFAEQQREIDDERALRIGEWVAATPYATRRMAALRLFARDTLSRTWAAWFAASRNGASDEPARAMANPLPRRAFAGAARRWAAFAVDASVVGAVTPPESARLIAPLLAHAHVWLSGSLAAVVFLVYLLALVGTSGQTLGMIVVDIRVVDDRFGRVGLLRAVGRYLCFIASFAGLVGFFRCTARVQPFERWSHTRLVQASALARRRFTVEPGLAALAEPTA